MGRKLTRKVNSTDSGTTEEKQLDAITEWNESIVDEVNNLQANGGFTDGELDGTDQHQLTKSIVNIANSSNYFNASGTNAYTLTQFNGNSNLLPSKFDRPITVRFQVPNTNTSTATTLLINGSVLVVKNLKDSNGSLIAIGKLATGDIVEATYFSTPIDEWRLQNKFSSTVSQTSIQNKLFSVNSGRVGISGNADFLQRDSNTQITVLAGGGSPNLVYTHYNATQNILQSNQVISGITNTFNGLYKVIAENSNAPVVLQVEGDFTAQNANNSPTLTNIVGLDWTKIAVGQQLSGLSIPAGATILSFVNNVSITLTANMSPAQPAGTARTVKFLNCQEETVLPTTALIDGMYFINTNPLLTYKRVGGAFVLSPFTQFGEFRIVGGVIPATITSYAYNGINAYKQETLANGTAYTINDNIGSKDVKFTKYIEFKVAINGFAIGDRLFNPDDGQAGTGTLWYGIILTKTTTSQYIATIGNAGITAMNRTTGAVPTPVNATNCRMGIMVEKAY